MLQFLQPQNFFIGADFQDKRGFPPVPRLPLGEVFGESVKGVPAAPVEASRFDPQAGLTMDARRELESLGLEVVYRGQGVSIGRVLDG